MNLHDFDIAEEAKREATQQMTIETARNFYANGASIELIAKSLKMSIEEIQKIIQEPVEA